MDALPFSKWKHGGGGGGGREDFVGKRGDVGEGFGGEQRQETDVKI